MKKYVLLSTLICFALPFTSGCSFFNPSSNVEVSAPKDNTEESASNDTISDSPKHDESDNSQAPKSSNADTNESEDTASEAGNADGGQPGSRGDRRRRPGAGGGLGIEEERACGDGFGGRSCAHGQTA